MKFTDDKHEYIKKYLKMRIEFIDKKELND